MDDWEKLIGTLLPEKEDFYSHFNMEDITDAGYTPAKRACKDFKSLVEIKTLGDYHGLHVQIDTLLLLADVFQDIRNMCLQRYKLDPTRFLTAPG